MLTPHVEPISAGSCHADREMRCPGCGTRVFSSLAPELISSGQRCPYCDDGLELVPEA